MSSGSARLVAACLRSMGVDADVVPPSDDRTRELGARFTNGDECYPAKITLGDFLRLLEQPGADPAKIAFFMPTADGPCRFGQYATFFKSTLAAAGYPGVTILSPLSEKGYTDMGENASEFVRSTWRALVVGELLLKLLLKTRPYETEPGAADSAFEICVTDLSRVFEKSYRNPAAQMNALKEGLHRAGERFGGVSARYDPEWPLIGIVGEIFCRLNTFSNDELVRRLEALGGEAWMSDIGEWILFCNAEEMHWMRLKHRAVSLTALGSKLREHFQKKDAHDLESVLRRDLRGYEEPENIGQILDLGNPYLPRWGAIGEVVLNVGRSAYLARKGVDGIIDISPFTCMNGIIGEAMYPRISQDYAGIPIRNFYFDGTQSDLDRDLEIYLELARNYRARKPWPRTYPACFPAAPARAATACAG